jgi:Transposase DNA-binding/Transposase Tn5 dimerisation domain
MKGRQVKWAEQELREAELGDKRRARRAIEILGARANRPSSSLPESLGSGSGAKAGYRFYESDEVEAKQVIAAHSREAVGRAKAEGCRYVLAIQDTTHVEVQHRDTWIHSTLLASPERVAYGVIDQQVWDRPVKGGTKKKDRQKKPTSQKESNKWLAGIRCSAAVQSALAEGQNVVCVADRESDVFDAMAEANKQGIKMLIRASQDRRIAEDDTRKLWEYVTAQAPAGSMQVRIQRNSDRNEREATCTVRYAAITLQPPVRRANKESLEAIQVVAIHVSEVGLSTDGSSPIEWLLLTSLEVATLADAITCVGLYAVRWVIELFHKTLKSGCRIEDRQFESLDNFCRYLALDTIVAWRLLYLTFKARVTPHAPCTDVLENHEWRALFVLTQQAPLPPNAVPSLAQAILWIAKLGGFLARKSDGPPGSIVLWRGLARLHDATSALLAFHASGFVGNG